MDGEKPEISVQINSSIYDKYKLGSAIPVDYAVNKKNNNFDLGFPVPFSQVGIDVLDPLKVSISASDMLFLRNLDRKKRSVKTYIILVDACNISENMINILKKKIDSIKKITGIGMVIFSSVDKLHLMIRTILEKHNKNG